MKHQFCFQLLFLLFCLTNTSAALSYATNQNNPGPYKKSWCLDYPPVFKQPNQTQEAFVDTLFTGYQKHHRPPNCNDGNRFISTSPTIVQINMFIQSFGSVSVVDMDYSVDMFLRQRWGDSRLRFKGIDTVLSLNYMKDKLWIPDLFFRNSKEGKLHSITTPNHLIWVYPEHGSVLFSQKLSVKLDCPMQLWNFPMDSQICRIEMGSYGYPIEHLNFEWYESEQVILHSKLEINEFQFPTTKYGTCAKSYNSTGSFACIYIEFHLIRKFGFYLIYTYLPSILVVMLSWVSFWIDYTAVPARISLGLLCILALITQAAATLQKLPRVSYVKAIDVWLFACLAFVVLSLLEFSLVNVLARHQHSIDWKSELRRTLKKELASGEYMVANGPDVDSPLMVRKRPVSPNSPGQVVPRTAISSGHKLKAQMLIKKKDGLAYKLKAQWVDRFSLFLFPASYGIFNAIYWVYFLMISSHQNEPRFHEKS